VLGLRLDCAVEIGDRLRALAELVQQQAEAVEHRWRIRL